MRRRARATGLTRPPVVQQSDEALYARVCVRARFEGWSHNGCTYIESGESAARASKWDIESFEHKDRSVLCLVFSYVEKIILKLNGKRVLSARNCVGRMIYPITRLKKILRVYTPLIFSRR